MKLSKIVLALAAGSAVSGVAAAQTAVTAKKQEGFKLLIPGLYGKVELRQDTLYNATPTRESTPSVSVLPSIGTTLWNKAVDTSFTARYVKSTENPVLQTAEFYNETSWAWLKGEYGSIGPYAYTAFDTASSQLIQSNIGLNFTFEHSYPVAMGDVTVKAFTEPKAALLGNANPDKNVSPRNGTGKENFGLEEGADSKVPATQAPVYNDSGFSIKVAPAGLKALTLGAAVDVAQQWKPKYVATDVVGNKLKSETDGYEYRVLSTPKLMASYQLKEGLKIGGELRHNVGGFFDYTINPETAGDSGELAQNKFQSRISLSADLF
jgi:hypothetical protein